MSAVGDARKRLAESTQPDPTAADVRAAQVETLRAVEAELNRGGFVRGVASCPQGPFLALDRVADRLATDTAAPEGVLSEEYAENLIGFVRTFETGEAAASALPIFLRTATRPAAPVAVEGVETVADCGQCFACVGDKPAYEGTWLTVGMTRMIVCAQCGNKRCPHSTDHRNDCTGSNEPGQVGSRYGEWSPVEPETSEPEGGAR